MRPVRRKSLTFRLTLLFAAASTVVLLVLGLIVAESVEHLSRGSELLATPASARNEPLQLRQVLACASS